MFPYPEGLCYFGIDNIGYIGYEVHVSGFSKWPAGHPGKPKSRMIGVLKSRRQMIPVIMFTNISSGFQEIIVVHLFDFFFLEIYV
jgi:hypothetical protein